MYCEKCGKELSLSEICPECGIFSQSSDTPTKYKSANRILFSALSYIGVFWLFGFLISPDKEDQAIRFHVAQGMILTIFGVVINIIAGIFSLLIKFIFEVQILFLSATSGGYTPPVMGGILSGILWLATYGMLVSFTIIGIVNAARDEQRVLPLIGGLAFYK